MFRSRFLCLLTLPVLALSLCAGAAAAEVDCDSVYCFSGSDFSNEDALAGICVTDLPDANTGTVLLGSRVIRPGDILTADQLARMTFVPLRTEVDQDAAVSYLPIYNDHVAQEATMTIAIRGKEDKAPVAEDSSLETYKNLPNEARLKATDPEGQALTYTVTRQPKRGSVTIREDGTFVYTPNKNKVGVDSFTFTATDPAGNLSREATVTIRILKPSDDRQYSDTAGTSCRFTAEWMRSTGIFSGEQVGDNLCFNPGATVSRGEFLTMVMKTLNLPVAEDAVYTGFTDEAPEWLKPYLAAAMRCGLVSGYPGEDGPVFQADQPITGAEAAVMLQNALELPTPVSTGEDSALPVWAAGAIRALNGSGIALGNSETVTRAEAADALYQASLLADSAQGLKQYQ